MVKSKNLNENESKRLEEIKQILSRYKKLFFAIGKL